MKNVVLIAVGGIGFRHFQAILNCEQEIHFYVVDISKDALIHAKEYADSIKTNKEITYLQDVSEIPEHIDVAVIATASLQRRSVYENLVAEHKVDYIIFEKMLFPKMEDYEAVGNSLAQSGIKAYVDCTARMYDFYKQIKEENKGSKYFNAFMKGSNWGLACNAIHLVDQVAFMAGAETRQIACSTELEDEIVESKRKGYVEFFGKIIGNIGENCSFVIECDHKDNPLEFEFFTEKAYYYVNESAGAMVKVLKGQSSNIERIPIKISYVSQLTNINVDKLLTGKEIDLTTYEESRPLHESLLKAFLVHMNKVNDTDTDLCPIT